MTVFDQVFFSVREQQVLYLFAHWHITDEEIGAELQITPSAAHWHVCNLMKKTGIHDRARLIRYAHQKFLGINQGARTTEPLSPSMLTTTQKTGDTSYTVEHPSP